MSQNCQYLFEEFMTVYSCIGLYDTFVNMTLQIPIKYSRYSALLLSLDGESYLNVVIKEFVAKFIGIIVSGLFDSCQSAPEVALVIIIICFTYTHAHLHPRRDAPSAGHFGRLVHPSLNRGRIGVGHSVGSGLFSGQ